MSRICRMSFKRKKIPEGLKQQRLVDALHKVVRVDIATRRARQVEDAQFTPVGIHDVDMSRAEASADLGPAARPITAEDLVAVIMGVLQTQ